MNLLFVCTMNKMRSKTAEKLFEGHPTHTAKSAGLDKKATRVLTADLIEWADRVYVFENWQRRKVGHQFKHQLKGKDFNCLYIPDEYDYMDSELVRRLKHYFGLGKERHDQR